MPLTHACPGSSPSVLLLMTLSTTPKLDMEPRGQYTVIEYIIFRGVILPSSIVWTFIKRCKPRFAIIANSPPPQDRYPSLGRWIFWNIFLSFQIVARRLCQPNSPTTSPNVEFRDSKDGIWEEEPLQQVWQWTPLRLVLAFEVEAKGLSI